MHRHYIYINSTLPVLGLGQLANMTGMNALQYNSTIAWFEANQTNLAYEIKYSAVYGTFSTNGVMQSAGQTLNYLAYNGNGTIARYSVAITKAVPKVSINVAGVTVSKPNTTETIRVPILPSQSTYNLTIVLNGSALNNLGFSYNISYGGAPVGGYSANITSSSVNRTLKLDDLPAGKPTRITFDAAGNNNYTAVDPTASVIPTGIVYYVPITITNSQTTATSGNFQQMIEFNSLAYQQYESSNLQNIVFFYTNGTLIPSWLEGNYFNEMQTLNLYTSQNTIYWILVWNSIKPGSANAITVFLGFASNTVSLFDGVTTGTAPQLYCANGCPETYYGQYDDGNNVFSFYDNFVGTGGSTLSSDWSSTINAECGTLVVANSLEIPTATTNSCGIISAKSYSSYPYWFEGLLLSSTTLGTTKFSAFGEGTSTTFLTTAHESGYEDSQYLGINGTSGTANVQAFSVGSAAAARTKTSVTATANVPSILGVAWAATSKQNNEYNYFTNVITTNALTIGSQYFSIGVLETATGTYNMYVQWARAREYPPNGVMPGVSISSSATAGRPSVTINPASPVLTTGGNVVLTATATGGSGTYSSYQWYSNTISNPCATANSISGATQSTYNTGPLLATINYCVEVTDTNGNNGFANVTAYVPLIPGNIIYLVPVNVLNTQTVTTKSDFQQMVSVNSLYYQQYEDNSLNNVEFFYSNGIIVPSWLEGNVLNEGQTTNLYASQNTIYWLNISSGVLPGAPGIVQVLMGFGPSNTNLFTGANVGAAPQLECASGCPETYYGQYDNGGSIFSFYDNFIGTTLSSKWTTSNSAGITVNNGLLIGALGTSSIGIASASAYSNYPYWLDGLVESSTTSASQKSAGFEQSTSATFGSKAYDSGYEIATSVTANTYNGIITSAGAQTLNTLVTTATRPAVLSIGWYGNGFQAYTNNYANLVTASNMLNTIGSIYFDAVVSESSSATYDLYAQWIRARVYPPGGVMPQVSFSGTMLGGTNFTETGLPAGAQWSVTFNSITEDAIAPNSITYTEPLNTYSFTIPNVVYLGAPYNVLTPSGTSYSANIFDVQFASPGCSLILSNTAITFGNPINPNSNTATANLVVDTNTGGTTANIFVYGSSWVFSSNSFGVGNTLWNPTSLASYGGNALTGTFVDTAISLPANTGTAQSNNIYFGLEIPSTTPAGIYTQNIVIENSC